MEEKRQSLGSAEMSEGVSKDIISLMFHELDHTSSKHGWQPKKHIADQDPCVCVCVYKEKQKGEEKVSGLIL